MIVTVESDTWVTCPRCNGKPGDFDDPRYGCNRCHGGGKVRTLGLQAYTQTTPHHDQRGLRKVKPDVSTQPERPGRRQT
jgi:DnaJ-class molecular chaperone